LLARLQKGNRTATPPFFGDRQTKDWARVWIEMGVRGAAQVGILALGGDR
jgi:hypothetical protein